MKEVDEQRGAGGGLGQEGGTEKTISVPRKYFSEERISTPDNISSIVVPCTYTTSLPPLLYLLSTLYLYEQGA